MQGLATQRLSSKIGQFEVPTKIYKFTRKDCFQNKSKFITEDHFIKHMNVTIR